MKTAPPSLFGARRLHVSREQRGGGDEKLADGSILNELQVPSASGVRLATTDCVGATLRWLERAGSNTWSDGRVVACVWHRLPIVSIILNDIIDRLAETALALWPRWYGPTYSFDDADSRSDVGGRQNVLVTWYRAAAKYCERAIAPRPKSFPLSVHATQLALAIEPERLLLILAVDGGAEQDNLSGLARAAEWLASRTRAPVLVLVPREACASEALDSINFETIELSPVGGCPTRGYEEKQNLLVWPLCGHPHPSSLGEQLLAAHLNGDADLAGLFDFNQFVETTHGSRFLVDLLWQQGKIVVEVDGYRWHGGRESFSADRHRDYELLITGYLTLRLPHDEVVADVPSAINKIRSVVALRRQVPFVGETDR